MKIFNTTDGILLCCQSDKHQRDFVQKYKIFEFGEFKARSKDLEAKIEEYKEWLIDHGEELEAKIFDKFKECAKDSDQAQTPKWLKKQIREFILLTQSEIFDAFIFQRAWKNGKHFNGFDDGWFIDVFVFINHPFTQTLAALKKCGDF